MKLISITLLAALSVCTVFLFCFPPISNALSVCHRNDYLIHEYHTRILNHGVKILMSDILVI